MLHPVRWFQGKNATTKMQRKGPGRRFPVQRTHARTHIGNNVCMCAGTVARDTTPGRVVLLTSCGARRLPQRANADASFAQHGGCMIVCVFGGLWVVVVVGGADLNDQPAKVDGARKPDKSRNKRLNLSRS